MLYIYIYIIYLRMFHEVQKRQPAQGQEHRIGPTHEEPPDVH